MLFSFYILDRNCQEFDAPAADVVIITTMTNKAAERSVSGTAMDITYVLGSICAAVGLLMTILLGIYKKITRTMRELQQSIVELNSTQNTTTSTNIMNQTTQTEPIRPQSPPPRPPNPVPVTPTSRQAIDSLTNTLTPGQLQSIFNPPIQPPSTSTPNSLQDSYNYETTPMELTQIIYSNIQVEPPTNDEEPIYNNVELPLKERLRSQTMRKEVACASCN